MKPVQILLAEDNQGDIYLVRDALAIHHIDHDLHVAKDGEQALRIVNGMGERPENPPPDIFLLDLNLPRVAGDVVLRRFRDRPACSETPVIVVSSSDAPADRQRVAKLGISHYFRKPNDICEFRRLGAIVKGLLFPPLTADSTGVAGAGS